MAATDPISLEKLECGVLRQIVRVRVAQAAEKLPGAANNAAVFAGVVSELGEIACVLKAAEDASVAPGDVPRINAVLDSELGRVEASMRDMGPLDSRLGEAKRHRDNIEATLRKLKPGGDA